MPGNQKPENRKSQKPKPDNQKIVAIVVFLPKTVEKSIFVLSKVKKGSPIEKIRNKSNKNTPCPLEKSDLGS